MSFLKSDGPQIWTWRILFFLSAPWLASCGHAPVKPGSSPRVLLTEVCSAGLDIRSSKGTVWIKAQSKDASGQFPAVVHAPSPDRLTMEVTNLIGGTEAVIQIEGTRYTIDVPKRKGRSEKGETSWAGIPLQWANALFLGRVPCLTPDQAKAASVAIEGADGLVVETHASLDRLPEKYIYRLKQVDGSAWPESLHWERQGIAGSAPIVVDFKFDSPEPKTRSPRKWEAKSVQGEVKVKWRDRQIETVR